MSILFWCTVSGLRTASVLAYKSATEKVRSPDGSAAGELTQKSVSLGGCTVGARSRLLCDGLSDGWNCWCVLLWWKMVKEVEKAERRRKWKTVKVNEEAYVLLRKISALLGLRQYEVMFIALLLMYTMMLEDVENTRKILEKLKERMIRQKWLVDNMIIVLDEILKR